MVGFRVCGMPGSWDVSYPWTCHGVSQVRDFVLAFFVMVRLICRGGVVVSLIERHCALIYSAFPYSVRGFDGLPRLGFELFL